MVILTRMDVFSVFCKILLSRIRFKTSLVCNAVLVKPISTEKKMFRNLKGGGRKILKFQIDLHVKLASDFTVLKRTFDETLVTVAD